MVCTAEDNKNSIDTSDIIRLWDRSKSEIFRLQLLNAYWEDTKTDAFGEFMQGIPPDPMKNSGFKEYREGIAKKKIDGVRIINMQVLDLPISDALKFGIAFLRLSEESGQKSLFVERKNVADLVKGFRDFYMFDSKIVLNVIYDKDVEGRYLGTEKPITDPEEVSAYIKLRDGLVKAAVPMDDFLRLNGIIAFLVSFTMLSVQKVVPLLES